MNPLTHTQFLEALPTLSALPGRERLHAQRMSIPLPGVRRAELFADLQNQNKTGATILTSGEKALQEMELLLTTAEHKLSHAEHTQQEKDSAFP